MKVSFDKSFIKAIVKIKNPLVLKRIENIIYSLESAESIENVSNIKKLIGYTSFYRIKMGVYRIGFELINDKEIKLITVLHRKDIYKKFP
jgi:mRNA interferase RelE/StbE